MNETFISIPKYVGIYQISNLANVKSLSRIVWNGKSSYLTKDKILKKSLSTQGYFVVNLLKGGNQKTFKISQLIAMAFFDYNPNGTHKIVIDHINNIKTDDRPENLQIITQRKNASKDQKGISKYTGVSWSKNNNKWRAQIQINGHSKYLGYFHSELDASNAYQAALNNL